MAFTAAILGGSKLSYKTTGGTAGTYTELANVKSIPSLGGSVDKEEATPINSKSKRYVPGLKDYGDLEFVCYFEGSKEGSNYRIVRDFEEADTVVDWEVETEDGTKFDFSGKCAASFDGGEAADVKTFTLTVFMNSDMTVVPAT